MTKYKNRLICFLDVLGFSNLLQTVPIEELHLKYSEFIDDAKNRTFYSMEEDSKRTNFAVTQIFSDSIILVSNDITDVYNVNNYIGAIHHILEIAFVKNFPLRGAITYGDFLVDDERNIFLSKQFPEIVKWESNQEWPGCVILKSAHDIVLEAAFGKKILTEGVSISGDLPVVKYEVPLKNGESSFMWCINYTFFIHPEILKTSVEYLAEPKKTNFLCYLNYIQTLPVKLVELGVEFEPAKYVKSIITRSGMRNQFLDKNGTPCEPGVKNFTWQVVGRWYD